MQATVDLRGADMKVTHLFRLLLALVGVALLLPRATAQEKPEDGINSGGYNIQQSLEFGGHITDFSGNGDTYNTFVNIHDGPRLLEHSLRMRALPGGGTLFDDLMVTSFGYGGDPTNATRLRVGKHKWYDLTGQFRRFRYFWNYNLLGNPFNPDNTVATFPQNQFVPGQANLVPFAPHAIEMAHRFSDFDLTLAPGRIVSVRLGYSSNRMEGSTLATYHEGPDVLLFQPWDTRNDRARLGIDLNFIPKTRISYDQYFDWYRYDTFAVDIIRAQDPTSPFAADFRNLTGVAYPFFQLNDPPLGNRLVDLGIVLERISGTSGQPCANPIQDATVDPIAVDPTCGGYREYRRFSPLRNRYPTERLSFTSRPNDRVELDGNVSYTSSRSRGFFDEHFFGRVPRTNQQQFDISGPLAHKRVSVLGNAGVTVHITDRLRAMYRFQLYDYRIPTTFLMQEFSLLSNSMANNLIDPTINSAQCFTDPDGAGPTPPTTDPNFCPRVVNSSPADLVDELLFNFYGQKLRTHTPELQFDFGRMAGGRIGYRFRDRELTFRFGEGALETYFPGVSAPTFSGTPTATRGDCAAGNAFGAAPDPVTGICTVVIDPDFEQEVIPIDSHSLLAGVWLRPVDAVRVSFDVDLMSADSTWTRLTPRKWQQYKVRVNAKPLGWINLGGTVNIFQAQNRIADINFRTHNRNYGFDIGVFRGDWLTLDLGYNFNDFESTNPNTCFIDRDPATSVPTGPADQPLAGVECQLSQNATFLGTLIFDNQVHSGSFNLLVKPVKRVTVGLGYAITSSTGVALDLQPDAPDESNSINWHLPSAMLAVDVHQRVTLKGQWNYYGYNEKFDPRRTLPRDFRGNVFTLSARYAF